MEMRANEWSSQDRDQIGKSKIKLIKNSRFEAKQILIKTAWLVFISDWIIRSIE